MALKINKDFSDSLVGLYENKKETDVAIENPFTYANADYSINLGDIDFVGNSTTSSSYNELLAFIRSLPLNKNNLFESDNEIYFYKIVELIKLSSDKNNLKTDSIELLKLWEILIKIVESKYNRKGAKDSTKFWTDRLAGFIESHIVELAIKQKLTEITNKAFNFIDPKYNILYAGSGLDQPDLEAENYTFEIKPERSNTSVHKSDFIIKYKVVATNSKVIFWVIPYMVGNYDYKWLDKIVQTKQSTLQFEVGLDSFRKELGLETHLTEATLRKIYTELLTNGNNIYQVYSKYMSTLAKAKSKKVAVDRLERDFIRSMNKTTDNKSLEDLEEIIKKLQAFIKTETDVQDSLKVEESNNFKTEAKENCNMSNLLEVYDLMEWGEYGASSQFWSEAKAGRLDGTSFWNAYSSDLRKLGLSDLLDTEYKELKEKSSYGKIKKAAEENPDSWAVKALLKMWVLQFKDGVKSNIRIKREEDGQKLATKKAELAEVEAQLPEFEKVFREVGDRILGEAADECNKLMKINNELINEIKEVSLGFVEAQSFIAKEIKDTNVVEMNFGYSGPTTANLTGTIYVNFEKVFGESVRYHWSSRIGSAGYSVLHKSFDIKEMTVDKIREEAEKLFTNLADAIKPHVGNISHTERIKATYEKTVKAIEDSKAAQAAVDAGKPVDPDFIAEVVAIFKNGLKRADAEYASWASWKYDDGDSGAAFEMEKYKTMNAAAVYLSNCNWRAYVNGREVASWKTTESEKALENALSKTFNATCADLNIEIIK